MTTASHQAEAVAMEPKDERERSGLAHTAGRAAFFPARAAARAWRGPLEEAVDEVLSAPEIARVIDRALAGSLPEEIARSLVRNRVLERIAAELAASGELDRLVTAALASPRTLELTDQSPRERRDAARAPPRRLEPRASRRRRSPDVWARGGGGRRCPGIGRAARRPCRARGRGSPREPCARDTQGSRHERSLSRPTQR